MSITSRRRAAVVAGGAIGAVARALTIEVVDGAELDLLWATFLVNVVGSLLLGFLVARHSGRSRSSPLLIPFVGVGILGAFTTFSLFSTEVFELLRAGNWWLAIAYPLGAVGAGFFAALVGIRSGASR
jgi:CrcB protein